MVLYKNWKIIFKNLLLFGLSFWSKIFFSLLFLVKIRLQTRFNSILDRKETFFDYKKIFKPWFWSKIGHFQSFVLGIIGQENVLRYSKTKKPLSRL